MPRVTASKLLGQAELTGHTVKSIKDICMHHLHINKVGLRYGLIFYIVQQASGGRALYDCVLSFLTLFAKRMGDCVYGSFRHLGPNIFVLVDNLFTHIITVILFEF